MNQASLEHAIDLAKTIKDSDALHQADKHTGKILLELLEDPKENIEQIDGYACFFGKKSDLPRRVNYFINYEEGKQLYQDMASALNTLVQELRTS